MMTLYTVAVLGSPANTNWRRNRKCSAFLRSPAFSTPTDRSMASNSLSMVTPRCGCRVPRHDEIGASQPLAVMRRQVRCEFEIEGMGDFRRHLIGQRKPPRGIEREEVVHGLRNDETRLSRAGRRHLALEKTPHIGRRRRNPCDI